MSNTEFTRADIVPFFETFKEFEEKNKLKANLAIRLNYDPINVIKKIKGERGKAKGLNQFEVEGVIAFFKDQYPNEVAEYLSNK